MKEAVVFGGQNSLDFFDVRTSVVRIPEVSIKIEEAQKIWDAQCKTSFSFHHFLCSEESLFFNNIHLKSLSLAIVQLGLYDRYKRLFRNPQYLVGSINNDSAMLVATGTITFQELIMQSQACTLLRPLSPLQITSTTTTLNGRMLPKFQAYKISTEQFAEIGSSDSNLSSVIQALSEQEGIQKIIHIGPGSLEKSLISDALESRDLQIVESIDVDPMLGWFWSNLRKQERSQELAGVTAGAQ
jgi:hypothetical protein